MKITAAIITFNEERNIERCIQSVLAIADEILVVDSFSKDRTKEICEHYGVKFIENKFEGHIQQKNFALQLASYPWVLSLDADEAPDAALIRSISELKSNERMFEDYQAFSMNRLTNYCGNWVKHSGWYPDTKIRLVNRNFAKWAGVNPHDKIELSFGSKVKWLQGDILHYSYYTSEEHYKQIEYFGDIAAKELYKQKKKVGLTLVIAKTVFQFIKTFVIKLGFLDGHTGYLIARRSAYATWRKYSKLKALYVQENNHIKN